MTDKIGPDADRQSLDLLLRGFQVARMLRLVADLFVADKIAPDGRIGIQELADASAVLPQPLLRVLRALAAFDIFTVDTEAMIGHTPKSRLLRTDTPNSLHHAARFWTAPGSWQAWGMLDVAMGGGIPHEAAWNTGRFAYLRAHPQEARLFDAMMANFPDNRHAAIAGAYDFGSANLIVDIGGGNGAALRQILGRFSTARGLVFDLPDVVASVPQDMLQDGRLTIQGGSFFDFCPPGADLYLIIRVLHDWPDDECRRILRNCRAVTGSDTRLLIGEQLLEADAARGDAAGYLIDVQMMTMFGTARARTELEFRELLQETGFSLRRVIPTASAVSILEAIPVET